MPRRAILVFADEIHVDLAQRAFPKTAQPLFHLGKLQHEIASGIDLHFFTSSRVACASTANVHRQVGGNFAARFENAVEAIARLGYEEVVAIGRDCPALRGNDIAHAFAELNSKKLVIGPDHRGGCYLIAFRAAERGLVRAIRWKRNTDCAQLLRRAGAAHVLLLPVKHDLDSWADMRLFASNGDARARLAKFLLEPAVTVGTGLIEFVSRAWQAIRIRQQMPPPAFAF